MPVIGRQVVSVPYSSFSGKTDRANDQDMAAGLPWVSAADAIAAQEARPQPLNPPAARKTALGPPIPDETRDYWLFRGKVYSSARDTLETLTAFEMTMLALEADQAIDYRLGDLPPSFEPSSRRKRAVEVERSRSLRLRREHGLQPELVREVSVPYTLDRGSGDLAAGMAWVILGGAAAQAELPQPLHSPMRLAGGRIQPDNNTRDYWLFRGKVYSTERGVCSSEDVKALALEGENKTKAKLARAHALMAQVDVLERGGREPIPDDVKMFVWQRDGGKCVRCGSNRNLEFDHIIPVSMGGANTARNLQLLCEGCNRAKGGSLV